jgi:hypothetical protein
MNSSPSSADADEEEEEVDADDVEEEQVDEKECVGGGRLAETRGRG